jgi:tRNA uridine 5-carboxymethylaminomethyl modification enzyme
MIALGSGGRVSAFQALRRPETRLATLVAQGDVRIEARPGAGALDLVSVETEIKYEGYLRRQRAEVERGRREERRPIPIDFRFESVPGLSREIVERLTQVRPATLGQALRVPGVTPAAVAVIAAYVSRWRGMERVRLTQITAG